MKTENTQLRDKKILITGGLGFIGSNLAHALISLGAKVTIYDACLSPYGWNWANVKDIKSDVEIITSDVRDYDTLARHVKGKDVIFHLAAQVGREISMENPELDTDINCNGTINLCKANVKNGNAKIIYAGSRGQIGEPLYLPVDEQHPTNPTDVYGINKLAAEKYLMLYGKIFNFPVVSLRLNNVYGPRCQMQHGYYGILNWFIKNIMFDMPITVYGDGLQTRDYVYVDDVVNGFILAAQSPNTDNKIYFIGSGIETVFLEMVKGVIKAVGKGSYKHIPFPPQRESIDVRKFVVTYEKFHQDTGWSPKIDLEKGIEMTVDYYKDKISDYVKN